jgi:hypothetical protein
MKFLPIPNNNMTSSFKCPICDAPLETIVGHKLSQTDGITIFCPNNDCTMADWGHGKDDKHAYEIFVQKCGKTEKVTA